MSITREQAEALARWYRAERAKRTEAVRNGTAKWDWIVPQYRVSFTEVQAYADSIGISLHPTDRIELDAAIKRLGRKKGEHHT